MHLLKSGRPYWWLWLIFGFPVVGLLAYIFLEVRPSVGRWDFQGLLWKWKASNERVRIRRDQLADANTVRNRLALADELHNAGLFDDECEVLSEGLRGVFKDDATLRMPLAQAHLDAGRAGEAAEILATTVPERSSDSQFQLSLLQARVAAGLGNTADAEQQYGQLIIRQRSEGPRYYYAELLLHQGSHDEALAILRDIQHRYRRGTPVWRHQERKWFYAAKRLAKTPRR